MKDNENGMSIVDILNKIWRQKFVCLAVMLFIMVVGVFIIRDNNRRQAVIETKFEFNFLNIENDQYPDGTAFNYRNIISLESLTKVKESDSKYNHVDVVKISEHRNTGIKTDGENGGENTVIKGKNYVLNLPLHLFDNNYKLAIDFIKDLLGNQLEVVIQKNSYPYIINELDLIDSTTEYVEELRIFSRQLSRIITAHNVFMTNYGEVEVDNYQVRNKIDEINNWASKVVSPTDLINVINNEGYVKNHSASVFIFEKELESALYRKQNLDNILTQYHLILNNAQGDIGELALLIAETEKQRVELQQEITVLQRKIDEPKSISTSPNLQFLFTSYRNNLNKFTLDFNKFYSSYLNDYTRLTYNYSDTGRVGNTTSLVVAAIGLLIIGLGVGALMSIGVDSYIENKKSSKKSV